ncbi:hypothetical protein [Nitratidesulfovibrio sp. SRB-5]|nr:hypothetical protein [Nitratidesulfovibrio sp. SRB-5]
MTERNHSMSGAVGMAATPPADMGDTSDMYDMGARDGRWARG